MVTAATRAAYLAAEVGTEITFGDILQFYVWIPRFKYRIEDDKFHNYTAEPFVEVVFEEDTAHTGNAILDPTNGFEDGEYLTHPAFCVTNNDDNGNGNSSVYLGDDCVDDNDWNLDGFWSAKFEIGTSNKILPTLIVGGTNNYIQSQYNLYATTCFTNGKNLNNTGNVYGFNEDVDDTHMMKGSEWGAISYLAYSKYGRGSDKVWNNTSRNGSIGCSGTNNNADDYDDNYDCAKYYNDATYGGKSSTTGNIYGIYDMNGGYKEYVASTKREDNPFNAVMYDEINTKYVDDLGGMYDFYNLDYTIGMGMWEVTYSSLTTGIAWFNTKYTWSSSTYPVLIRGGDATGHYNAGIGLFNYIVWEGYGDYELGWRPTIVVE